jgi:hypothetical protein
VDVVGAPVQGSPLIVTKTDVLTMEFVRLPILTTAVRFLYRFKAPIETVWQEGTVTHAALLAYGTEVTLGSFAIDTWKDTITENNPDGLPEGAQWLLEMKSVKIVECEIVPKGSNG